MVNQSHGIPAGATFDPDSWLARCLQEEPVTLRALVEHLRSLADLPSRGVDEAAFAAAADLLESPAIFAHTELDTVLDTRHYLKGAHGQA